MIEVDYIFYELVPFVYEKGIQFIIDTIVLILLHFLF